MVRPRLLCDTCSVSESAELAPRADPIDEYRELEMLAHAWEHGSLYPDVPDGTPGRVDDTEQKESVRAKDR